MPHESNVAAAPGDAALLRRETPDSQTRTPTSRRDLPSPAEPFTASQKKTTIEMVFDMRRAAEDKARTALMQSRSAPPPPASREARSLEPEVSERERPASGEGRVQLPLDTRSVVSGASASHDGEASPFEGSAWSPRAQEPRDRSTEWSSRQRRVHARMLAGAALALVIGTGVGYMAGKGESATSRAAVESTDSGMKLRLDRDLR